MKALLTADIHLTARPAEAYRWQVFPWLAKQAEKYGADTLILLGDVCDRKDLHPSRLVNQLVEILDGLPFSEIIWLAGNHDYADPAVPFFGFLEKLPRFKYVREPKLLTLGRRGETSGLFLPSTKNPEEVWSSLPEGVWRASYVFLHQPVYGAVCSNGAKIEEGQGLIKFLKSKTKAPCYAGDIHVQQTIGPLTYVGSPHPVHFGDTFDPRVILLDGGKELSIPRRTIKRTSLVLDDPAELREAILRAGDHVKLSLRMPRSAYGTWPAAKKELAKIAAELGLEVHGLALVPIEEEGKRTKASAPSAETSVRSPAATIRRWLDTSNYEDSDALAARGIKLFEDAGIVRKERKAGRIDFKALRVQGFKSIQKPVTLRFDNKEPGLYLLGGRNEVEPKLGANGVGKSTLLADAPCWALYGKTPRKVFGPSLVAWESPVPCEVSVELAKAEKQLYLTRTQKPNSLKLTTDTETIEPTNEDVAERLGLSLDEYLFLVCSAQSGRFFLDLGETERLSVFSDVLGLEVWELAADAVSVSLKKLKEKREQAASAAERAKGALDVRAEDVENALTTLGAAKEKLAGLPAADLRGAERGLTEASEGLASEAKKLEKLREDERQLEIELDASKEEEETYTKLTLRPAQSAVSVAESKLAAAKAAKAKVLGAGECPTCKQEIEEAHVKRCLSAAETEITRAEKELVILRERLKVAVGKGDDFERKRRLLKSRENDLRARRGAVERARDSAISLVEKAKGHLRLSKELRTRAEEDVTNAAEALSAAENRLEEGRESVANAEKNVAALDVEIAAVAFWQKGFRDLRFWLVREALTELTIETNNALSQLGLDGWNVSFDIERPNGSGGVTKGFLVFVSSPLSPPNTPWEAWSGGEAQRLRIAVNDALKHLIEARTGVSSNFEIIDEPTSHLSEEGVQDVLAYLANRARSEGKVIFIADHHQSLHGAFTGEYCVIKTKEGTRLKKVLVGAGE